MNKGLKNYTKHLTHTVGSATADFNLFERDANMHITIPLLSTKGLNPFGTKLIYNYQNKDISDELFGKGFKLDWYAKIFENENTIDVENADGSIDTYEFGYWHAETQKKASRVYADGSTATYHIEFEDRDGNRVVYGSIAEYPSKIIMKSGDTLNFSFIGSTKTISNGKGDVLLFCSNEEGRISTISYTYNAILQERVEFVYVNDKITVILYQTPDLEEKGRMYFGYLANKISITDDITKHRSEFNFNGNCLSSIGEGYGTNLQGRQNTIVNYYENKASITFYDNTGIDYYFDSEGTPLYFKNHLGYVVKTEYDSLNRLVSKSNPILINGSQQNYFAGYSMANFTLSNVTREEVTLTEPLWQNIVGDTIYKFSHSGSDNGMIIFEVPINCVATDNVTTMLWVRQKYNAESGKNVKFNMQIGNGCIKELKKPMADNNFELILLGASCPATQKTARYVITLTGDVSFELGGIQIFRQDFGSFFNYDENNGKISLLSRAGEVATRSYNAENQLSASTEFDTTINTYEYNSKGYPTKATSAHGIEISNEYHASYPSLLTKQTLTDKEDNKTIEVTKEYSSDGRHVTKAYDELGICVSNVTYENDKPKTITNANGAITTFDYEHDLVMSMLLEKNSAELSKAMYTYYDDTRRLKTVTLKNGSVYEFAYDFRGNVSNIKLNGIMIFSYYYEENTGNLLSIWYGPSSERYDFYYAQDNLIQDIYLVPTDGAGQHKYAYFYNDIRQLVRIEDGNGTVLIRYEYDAEGNVKKEHTGYSDIEYTYDNLNNINNILRRVQSKRLHESFSTTTRSQSEHPEVMKERFGRTSYFGLLDGTTTLKYRSNELASLGSGVTFGKDGLLPYGNIDANKSLVYQLTNFVAGDQENGCAKFWFKPSNVETLQYMLSIRGTAGHYVSVYLQNGKLYAVARGKNNQFYTLINGAGKVEPNRWNFLSLNFYYRDDGNGIAATEIGLTVNTINRYYTNSNALLPVDLGANPTYYIGRTYDGSSTSAFNGKITCLSIMPRTFSTMDSIKFYHNVCKDYITSSQYINNDEKTVDVSEAVAFMPSSTIYDAFEIFPLNNSVVSIKGKRPTKFSSRTSVITDKDKSFNFNPKSRRYAYVADGAELTYSFGQSNSGTYLMRAYAESNNLFQYLIEGKDSNGKTISLRRDGNNYLRVDCDRYEYCTSMQMSADEWHTVGMSFKKMITGDSENEEISGKIRVFLDGQVEEFEVIVDFTNLEFSIGRIFDAEETVRHTGIESECYPFCGQIEMLCVNNAYNETSTLNTLMTQIKPITKTNEFDDFGRVKQSCLLMGDNKILEKFVSYANRSGNSGYTSNRVSKDSFEVYHNGSNNGFERSYTYDNLGNVTAISDTTIGSHTYAYDGRGFLTRDDNTTFAYDGNGNITQKGNLTFTYDSTMKDKLVSVGGKPVIYSTNNVLAPSSYDGKSFAYEGKRLICFTDVNDDSYTYEYNDQGQRIKKITPDGLVRYIYSGNKLVSEIAPWHMLNFLYDENDQLYGFDIDGTGTYFYLRDSLQNIIGIIDSTGDLVVKYNYTAYGECTITSYSEGIAGINPFRYKGYYYDSESGMYYCNSRYYVPEWCRWLTADSPSFLQPESLNGMNLFAYCGNDPVNKVDSSGCFAILAALKRINNAINGVKTLGKWLYNNIGFAHTITSTIGTEVSNSMFGRTVMGAELDATINKGDFNKPITLYSQGSLDSGYLSEFEAGVSVNIGNGGIEHSLSLNGGFNLAVDFGGTAFELSVGPAECGIKYSTGTDFKNKTAKSYSAFYFRPIALAPVLIGMIAGSYYPTGVFVPAY